MSNKLQRITTAYHELEDRIQLTGETEQGGAVVIWLSQRLLQRLIPVLLQGVHGADDASAEVMQIFAQQAARAQLDPQAPVAPSNDSATWLATHIDVVNFEEGVRLTFRTANEAPSASIDMTPVPLRQWLNILHDTFVKADWPLQCWPDWVGEGMSTTAPIGVVLH